MNRVQILQAAERLIRYAGRVQEHLQKLDPREHQQALAALAETAEIARRLYDAVSNSLKSNGSER